MGYALCAQPPEMLAYQPSVAGRIRIRTCKVLCAELAEAFIRSQDGD